MDGQVAIGDAGGVVGGVALAVGRAWATDNQLAVAHLGQDHVTRAFSHQHGGAHVAAQVDQRGACGTALLCHQHPQFVGAQPGAGLAGQRALHVQQDVATAGVDQVTEAQVGCHAAHRPGGQRDVIGIAGAQGVGGGHGQVAEAGDADRTIEGLGEVQRERAAGVDRVIHRRRTRSFVAVDDPDVAGAGQLGTGDGVDIGLQADAGFGHRVQPVGAHHTLDHRLVEVVAGIGRGAVVVAVGGGGLRDRARGRAQPHRGAGGFGDEGGRIQADLAAVVTRHQHQVTRGGAQLGAAVGSDAAVARITLAGAQGDGAGHHVAAQAELAVGQQRGAAQRGTAGGSHIAGHAQQLAGLQQHGGGGLPAGLRAHHQGRAVQAEGGHSVQRHAVGRHPGGELGRAARQRVPAEVDQRAGIDVQRIHGRDLAAQRHIGAGVDDHVAAADRVPAALPTAGFLGVVHLGDGLHLGGVDGALLPHRDALHRLDLHLLGAGLEDGAVVVHRLGLGGQRIAELHAPVEQVLVLLDPVVAVVVEVFVAVAVDLEARHPVVGDRVVAEVAVTAVEGLHQAVVVNVLEQFDGVGLPAHVDRAGLVVEPAHAGRGEAVQRKGGAAVPVLVQHRSVAAGVIGIARGIAHLHAIARAGAVGHVGQALHLIGREGIDIAGRAHHLVGGANPLAGTGRRVEADGEVAVPLLVGNHPVDVVVDAVEADDAVAFALVVDVAARPFPQTARTPAATGVAGDDGEVFVTEPQHAAVAAVAQAHHRHHRVDHRLGERDATRAVAGEERDVLVGTARRRVVDTAAGVVARSPALAAPVHAQCFAREAGRHAQRRARHRAVAAVALNVTGVVPVDPVDEAVGAAGPAHRRAVDRVADVGRDRAAAVVVPQRALVERDGAAGGGAQHAGQAVAQLVDALAVAVEAHLPAGAASHIGHGADQRICIEDRARLVVLDPRRLAPGADEFSGRVGHLVQRAPQPVVLAVGGGV